MTEQSAAAPRVKALGGGRIGGYLVTWGTPERRDLHGEYFTAETELGLDWYERRPLLYHHGLDAAVKAAMIGVIDRLEADETGVWAEAQLDLRRQYAREVLRLIERGVLGWSSGSLAHLVVVAEDGHIRRWPIIEGSVTPTPAEPRQTEVQVIKAAYDELGMILKEDGVNEPHATPVSEAPRRRLPFRASDAERAPQISVSSPLDGLEALDLLHGYLLLRQGKAFSGVSERYANALGLRLRQAGYSAVKADELSRSTLTAFGDEWVPDLWSAQIWKKARVDNVIMPLLPQVEMQSNPYEVPVEGADPLVYYVPETADEAQLTLGAANPIPDSRIGSGKVQLTARKLALRTGFSAELVEDAIVPVLALYREQAVRAIADAIDHVLLNGDTTTTATGNVNKDHAAPAATDRYLAFDGLRKLAITTNTANKVDAANVTPTLALLRQTRFKLDARYAVRPADLVWICDAATYARLLAMPEFMTMDKVGAQATVLSGQIGMMDGAPVVVSAEMPLTEADGKVGAGPNDRGTAVCVYRPGWVVGYRRRIAVSVDYLPYTDSYQVTATVRLALANYDNEVAAALFNLAV
jgi:HK97 family phage major capsid protein